MGRLIEVSVTPAALNRLAELLTTDRVEELRATVARGRRLLAGRSVWNINSTATGGGVAEMLATLLAYGRGAGVDTRWLVIHGDAEFFTITKRVHNALHGWGNGGELGPIQRAHYEAVLADNLVELRSLIHPGDIVLLHDPQTAGLAAGLADTGVHVIWRCHIGIEQIGAVARSGWDFLRPYLDTAPWFVFSRKQYAPAWIPPERLVVIPPSIDPFAVKNYPVQGPDVERVLRLAGLVDGDGGTAMTFTGRDGGPRVLRRREHLLWETRPAPPGARLVTQVSRWDTLKDMSGVMDAFADQAGGNGAGRDLADLHLFLLGPAFEGVADDPESAAVFADCVDRRALLPAAVRQRVHLIRAPVEDVDENALIVNAVQRRAQVVMQKSLAEGFGLTVTEAMWKARPVVASAVGGIADQIVHEQHGLLVDPHDTTAAGLAMRRLLADPALAAAVAAAAQERVRTQFLGDRHLRQYVDLFERVLC